MKLRQDQFIWLMKNMHIEGGLTQDSTSVLKVQLRKNILITHDYAKGNRVEVTFLNDGKKYLVDDHNQLQELMLIHLQNKNCEQLMRRKCAELFEEIK